MKNSSQNEKKIRLINLLFVAVIMLVLFAGLIQTAFFPDDITDLENRYANKISPLTAAGYMDGSYQSDMEAALGDQVTLSTIYKRLYHEGRSYILHRLCEPLLRTEHFSERYFSLNSVLVFGGENLVYFPYPDSRKTELDARIEDLNKTFAAFPQQDFYLYYIERDVDINFETGEKQDFYGYISERLQLPQEKMSCFSVNSFEEYSRLFFKTDHHWNHVGSYLGYCRVLELLGCGDEPLSPTGTLMLSDSYSGSKAVSCAASFSEDFYIYSFSFPPMDILINGLPAADYGSTESGLRANYPRVYGDDCGEIVFSTSRPEKEDLLIIGESFDNAILKLLASHYDSTFSVDLRYYEAYTGKSFVLSEYLAEHPADKVLLIGNIDYYLLPDFMLLRQGE